MIDALMMAGGMGKRMRTSYGPHAKPLVRVCGLELIERNLAMLMRVGCREVAVSVPASIPALTAWLATRGALIVKAGGGSMTLLEETTPLDTIGIASRLRGATEVVVVNADNLVTFDFEAFRTHHRFLRAALTVATHIGRFRVPFGEVAISNGRLTAYREKPEIPVRVSSGTYVLGPEAIEALAPEARCSVPELVTRLFERGAVLGAFEHDSPWIDVNDAESLAHAERLVTLHPDRFERHACEPDVVVVGAVLHAGDRVLLERRPPTSRAYAGLWDTPGGKLERGEGPLHGIVRELEEELGISPDLQMLAVFDDIDPTSGCVYRHHVFEATVAADALLAREGQILEWCRVTDLLDSETLSTAARRSLAWASRRKPT
jgi:8-oxo-dGTP pyrophosphatase MutT (NUDIX family)